MVTASFPRSDAERAGFDEVKEERKSRREERGERKGHRKGSDQ